MSTAVIENPANLRELAEQSHAWPFEEARKIVARLKKTPKDVVIFETGYGPSGLPHIGTFGEVARTTMVRHAFRVITDDKIKTRLIAFSDDMDGLRKVPDNVPNKDMVAQHLGKPLTKVPDPFGTHDSFAAHNNARLRAFLDQFGFDYEFMSSTECYMSGRFDAALLKVLERFDAVMNIMLPSLREERAESYSPFLPISPRTGIVLQVPVVAHDAKAGTITYEDPESRERVTTLVTGGRCKLQWKPDWAMRWVALGVDYEMAGKDLIDSVKLSGEICRALGGTPPEGFNYELFLDENGQKISKSKGNGLTIDEWLRYASPESLSLFMYREPKAAKRLYFDVIPRNVDEYLQFLDAYPRQGAKEQLGNPVWHIHSGAPPKADNPVPFAMLLSLVTASNAENADTLWGFIARYRPGVTKETHPKLAALVDYAVNYYHDFVSPRKRPSYARPGQLEALVDLRNALSQLPADADAQRIQDVVYEIGRREPYLDQKKRGKDGKPGVSLDWFNMLYRVLLGQGKGPRFGSFVAAYGIDNTREMIVGAVARAGLGAPTYIPPRERYRLYFDEHLKGEYLSLTGLIVRQDIQERQIAEQLKALKQSIFGDTSVVLHRHEIEGLRGKFAVFHDDDLRNKFNSEFAEIVKNIPATVLTVSVNKKALSQTKWSFGPFHYALVQLLEQFVFWLDRSNLYGDVIGEMSERKQDGTLRRAFRHFYENGTNVLNHNVIQQRLISRELLLGDKKANIAALQIADMVAYPAHRNLMLLKRGEPIPHDYWSSLVAILEDFKYDRKNDSGKDIEGWGRKWLP
jgi:lysyl-tRNA synthetase class 1